MVIHDSADLTLFYNESITIIPTTFGTQHNTLSHKGKMSKHETPG